ncbi:hypothetical protein GCM10009754_68070 [Amycolatopsis minnesotensis]|uniref:Uncharacterized protein n=2 Tax=Amycolatopsis minnesotensis TaxID=337894 RepID=A0ABN2S750_9PSEU
MRARPFGAGRKRQRSPARYETSYVVKSEVVVSSLAERLARPPRQVQRRRSRIIHPEPVPPAPYDPPRARPAEPEPPVPATSPDTPPDPAEWTVQVVGPDRTAPVRPRPTVPSPATVANLIRAKTAQPERGQAPRSARTEPSPAVTRRRGRRVSPATTPVVRRKRRARRPDSVD